MVDIQVIQRHAMDLPGARAAAQEVADRMARDFAIQSVWQGDVLAFNHSGLSGTLAVHATEARLEITLGALFKAFAPVIEEKVTRNLAKVFGAATS